MTKENFKKWMQLIPVTIGIIYCWFGFQKFIPGLSLYEDLARQTMAQLAMGTTQGNLVILLLGILECSIGIMLIFYDRPKYTLVIALAHISCTFLPLLLVPGLNTELGPVTWLKNVLIMAGLLIMFPYKKQVAGAHVQPFQPSGMHTS
jgi:hypothetical protein